MRFELHCHSTCSDGTEAPARVAARAVERGVEVFALTDHDTCAGTADARPSRAKVLRGVELSCDERSARRSIHILAYDRRGPEARDGAGWRDLEQALEVQRVARRDRLREMAARLARCGVTVDIEPLIAEATRTGRTVGRPDLARAMLAAGAVTSFKEAFTRYLHDGGPVDVPHHALTVVDALALGRAAGAAMALAHPHVYDALGATLLRRHRDDGLTGVEAYYAGYDARERARWIQLADELGLVCTGGSDWHGPEETSVPPGVDLPADRAARLLAWLSPQA